MATGELLLDVKIPGEPPTKERARTFVGGDKKTRTITPAKTRSWEQAATAHFRLARGKKIADRTPVALRITAVASRTAKILKGPSADRPGRLPCLATPDVDNIAKIVMDALAPSRTSKKNAWICVLQDDTVVVDAQIRKFYVALGEKAHIRIQVYAWAPDADIDETYAVEDLPTDEDGEAKEAHDETHEAHEAHVVPGSTAVASFASFGEALTAARATLQEASFESAGATCPCCDKFVKRYRRMLNATMARGLIWLVKASGPDLQWIHFNKVAPRELSNKGGSLATLIHWELVEQMPKNALPKEEQARKRTSGSWRPTAKGIAFARNQLQVPSHVHLYNDAIEGWSEKPIDIVQALGKAFHYGELMAAYAGP
jgi:Holliday junction resolvase RusA-like endonuclease